MKDRENITDVNSNGLENFRFQTMSDQLELNDFEPIDPVIKIEFESLEGKNRIIDFDKLNEEVLCDGNSSDP